MQQLLKTVSTYLSDADLSDTEKETVGFEDRLLQAVKKDDVKEFDALTENARRVSYRLGRFPLLSLLYLYRARKILAVYEEGLLQNASFDVLREPLEISKKFSAKAGKCLRLYLDEVVSPLEMLLILDSTKRLKKVFPYAKTSSAVKARLKSIYSIKYSLNVKFEGDSIIIDRRPLSRREMKNILAICLGAVLAIMIVVGVPVTTVSLMPKPVEGEVTKYQQIDFGAAKQYTLKKDIVLPKDFSVEKVNCRIIGGGHKLILSEGVSLGSFSGELSGVTVESLGYAVFDSVSEGALIDNVTVNVNADITFDENGAFVTMQNNGIIQNVTVNVRGKINAVTPPSYDEKNPVSLIFGGIAYSNSFKFNELSKNFYGGIQNCTVNFSQFELAGELHANASFGGVVGINDGLLSGCTVMGEIAADTFDVAGICAVNNCLLVENVNESDISQTSKTAGWNPIVCGIALSNNYNSAVASAVKNSDSIQNCENRGSLSSISDCGAFEAEKGRTPAAQAAGIAYESYGNIYNCANIGAIEVKAEEGFDVSAGGIALISYGDIYGCQNIGDISLKGSGTAYAGGIAAQSVLQLSYCRSSGGITVSAKDVYAGGILGFSDVTANYKPTLMGEVLWDIFIGAVYNCISECSMSISAEGTAHAGGIVGFMKTATFTDRDWTVYYLCGEVSSCYFAGDCNANVTYFGSIVGVCNETVFKNNSVLEFRSGNLTKTERSNFADNRYVKNAYSAFGATMKVEDDDTEHPKTVYDASAENKGAVSVAKEEIGSLEGYQAILNALEREDD